MRVYNTIRILYHGAGDKYVAFYLCECRTCGFVIWDPKFLFVLELLSGDVPFRRVLDNENHVLHPPLPDRNQYGYELRRRRHDRALSHPMTTNATLFTDKYINTVTKNTFPILLRFRCSVAFWQLIINEYVMLCYGSGANFIQICIPLHAHRIGCSCGLQKLQQQLSSSSGDM